MAEDGGIGYFQVVFFDGEREIHMGGVRIHPSLEFKNFQSGLSKRIGISPNQISVYLVDCKKPKSSPEVRRKIPITGKVNFSAIAREKDCFFLVVLKRARRNRRPKPKQGGVDLGDYIPGNKFPPSSEKLLLLRRKQPELNNPQVSGYVSPHYNQIVPPEFADYNEKLQNLQILQPELNNPQVSGYVSPHYNQIASQEFADYNDKLQNLQILRENYAMMMDSNSNLNKFSNLSLDLDSFPGIEESFGVSTTMAKNRTVCAECANANRKGIPVPFHLCVSDVVIEGFRSSAGPVARSRIAYC